MKSKLLFTIIIIAFLPAVILGQNVIQIAAGDNKIDDALYQAQAGDIIELTTDGGVYHEQFTTIIDKPLTIRAAAGLTEKPVWICDSGGYMVRVWDDFTLEGIILDGAQGDSLTERGVASDSGNTKVGYNLKIDNCEFVNFTIAGESRAVYGNTYTQADSVIITNSVFKHIGERAIYYKDPKSDPGSVKYFLVDNCTFLDIGEEVIYVEDYDNDTSTPGPEFMVNHVTIHNPGALDPDIKAIYPKNIDGAVIKNSIITRSEFNENTTPVRIYGTNSVVKNVLFRNTDDINKKDDAAVDDSKLLEQQIPYFADADNGNFALAANSPAALFAEDSTALGDTTNGTWDASAITRWELVKNSDWGRLIKSAVTSGDTIMFVSDGGDYYSPAAVSLPSVPLVLMANPGASEKPVICAAYGSSRLVKFSAGLTVNGLKFQGDGIATHPDSLAAGKEANPYGLRAAKDDSIVQLGNIIFEDCVFSDLRLRGIHLDKKNHTDMLIVNNCIFRDIGECGIRGKESTRDIDYAKFTNSTFYKIGDEGIYLTNVGNLEVSHCTFFFNDSTISGRSGGGVKATDDSVVVIRDNLFVKQQEYGAKVYGPSPTVEYNLFWDIYSADNIVSADDSTLTFPIFNFEADPIFKDTTAANLDLALELNSPAVGVASDGSNLGDPRWGTWDATGVNNNDAALKSFQLSQNYPNPFNPVTSISYTIARNSNVQLSVFNLLGGKIATIVDKNQAAGEYTIHWNATDDNGRKVASGVYFYRIQAGDFVSIKKMLLLK